MQSVNPNLQDTTKWERNKIMPLLWCIGRHFILTIICFGLIALSACDAEYPEIEVENLQDSGEVIETNTASRLPTSSKQIEFSVSRVTWMSSDIDIRSDRIIVDALGGIYAVQAKTGDAEQITSPTMWLRHPRVSPDGDYLAAIDYPSDSEPEVVVFRLDTMNVVERIAADAISFDWLDNQTIILTRDVYQPFEITRIGGESKTELLHNLGNDVHGAAVDQGTGDLFFGRYDRQNSNFGIYQYDFGSLTETPLVVDYERNLVRPQPCGDGRFIAYVELFPSRSVIMLRDMLNGIEVQVVESDTVMPPLYRTRRDLYPSFRCSVVAGSIVVTADGGVYSYDIWNNVGRDLDFILNINRTVVKSARVESDVVEPMFSSSPGVSFARWPSLTKDRAKLAYSHAGALVVHDIQRNESVTLGTDQTLYYSPVWSADNTQLYAIAADVAGYSRIVAWDMTTGEVTVVCCKNRFLSSLAISDDGETLGFFSSGTPISFFSSRTRYDLNTYELSTGNTTTLSSFQANSSYLYQQFPLLDFSLDGSELQFLRYSRGTGSNELVSVKVGSSETNDGTHGASIAVFPSQIDSAALSPSGKFIAVTDRTRLLVLRGPTDVFPNHKGWYTFDPLVFVHEVTAQGATYVRWISENELIWSEAGEVFKWSADGDEIETLHVHNNGYSERQKLGSVTLTGARIITMKGDHVIEDGFVAIDNGVIKEVSHGVPTEDQIYGEVLVVDGATIVPGYVDTHSHISSGIPGREYWPIVHRPLLSALAYGVTTHFDPSSPGIDGVARQEAINAGRIIGPRVFDVGPSILGVTAPPPFLYGVTELSEFADAQAVVARHRTNGSVALKSYHVASRIQQRWLVEAARQEGMAVTMEGYHDVVHELQMFAGGHVSIEHYYPKETIYEDVIRFQRELNVFRNGTILVQGGGAIGLGDAFSCFRGEGTEMDRFFVSARWLTRVSDKKQACASLLSRSRLSDVSSLTQLMNGGVNVSVGSHGDMPGLGSHLELWTIAQGGANEMDLLRSFTLSGAKKIGIDRWVGSLEPGKVADLIVLNSNPLDDITNTADIRHVIVGGDVYGQSDFRRFALQSSEWAH